MSLNPFDSHRILPALVCLLTFLSCLSTTPAQEIDWQANPALAQQKAADQSKLVLLHFEADWCNNCGNLDRFVYSNTTLQRAFNNNIVGVRIDAEKNRTLVQEYGITTVPFDIVMTPSGRIVTKRKSPENAHSYIKFIEDLDRVLNGLEKQQPSLLQNLAEVQNNESSPLKMNGKLNSFTPNSPSHQSPFPSAESSTLSRKSKGNQVVKNPFLADKVVKRNQPSAPVPPAKITNQFAPATQQATQFVPTQKPAEFASANENQFATQNSAPASTTRYELGNMPNPQAPTETKESSSFAGAQPTTSPGVATSANPTAQVAVNNNAYSAKIITEQSATRTQAPVNQNRALSMTDHSMPASQGSGSRTQARLVTGSKQVPTVAASATIRQNPTPQTQPAPVKEEPQFALKGKCPVTLLTEGRWAAGDKAFGCVHRAKVYIFASKEKLELFKTNPDAYSPVLAGYDPVIFRESGKLVDGEEEYGVFMGRQPNQRIVLFKTPETRMQFQSNPQMYLESVRTAMQRAGSTTIR